jgi:hypothetical protein
MTELVATELLRRGACADAVAWVGQRKDPRRAWHACERGDWLLWIAAKVGVDRKLVVRAACACAREALRRVPQGEDRPRKCIEVAERWADGKASIEEVREVSRAASAAAASAAADAYAGADAYYAAYYAASYAAYAAPAYAAYYAAYAASAAVYASAANAYYAARGRSLRRSAELVRQHIPWGAVRDARRAS